MLAPLLWGVMLVEVAALTLLHSGGLDRRDLHGAARYASIGCRTRFLPTDLQPFLLPQLQPVLQIVLHE